MNAFARWVDSFGLMQKEIAEVLGVLPSEVTRYRKDGWWPRRPDIALRIFNLTNGEVTPNDLLEEMMNGTEKAKLARTQAGGKQRSQRRGKSKVVRRSRSAA